MSKSITSLDRKIFIATAITTFRQMGIAVEQKDAQSLGKLCQTFKKSCADIGATSLVHLCETLERKCSTGTLDGAVNLIAWLRSEFNNVRAGFESRIADSHNVDQPLKALVIDDVLENRLIFSQLLKKHGFISVEAASALDGLNLAHASPDPFPLVLLDVRLGDSSGFELCKQLSDECKNTIDAHRVIVSALPFEKHAEAAFLAGASDYLAKPVDQEKFAYVARTAKDLFYVRSQYKTLEEENRELRQQLTEKKSEEESKQLTFTRRWLKR